MAERADRLRKARIAAGFRNASLAARSLGVSQSTYIHHENGTRDFGEDAAAIYARRYHVTVPWLLLGEGEMATPDLIAESEEEAASSKAELEEERAAAAAVDPKLRQQLRESHERRSEKKALETLKSMELVPEITAYFKKEDAILTRGWRRYVGLQEQVTHPIVGTWGIPQKHLAFELGATPSSTILFQIDGNSNAPTLLHGDLVFVDTSVDDVMADGLYLVADKLSYPMVRRLQINLFTEPRSVTISTDASPEQRVVAELSAISIVGQVRGKISRI